MSSAFGGRPGRGVLGATRPSALPWLAAAAGLVAAGLFAWGLVLDASAASQPALFGAVCAASLLGAGGGALASARSVRGRAVLVLLALFSWRLAYFPIMVFSGHVASIGEWLLVAAGLRPVVWPVFLVAVAALHAAAVVVASWLLSPPRAWLRAASALVFVLASLVSLSTLADLRPLPDRSWSVTRAVPEPTAPRRNPYLPRLAAPGYSPAQRVLLAAAGLTYDTIPHSPWARVVKGVLEAEFDANPNAPTRERVGEHYLAYRSAHPFIGCRADACPPSQPPDPAR